METKDRNKTTQKIIKDKLSQYLSEEQLSMLDDLGIEILADYFSNHQLREMAELQPAQVKGLVDRNQSNEVKRRLTAITEEDFESGRLMDWYKENCSEIEEVYDPQAKKVIALEVKHNELKNSTSVHWDGRFIVAVGDRLASTRTRLDGVVGYQSNIPVQNPAFVEEHSAYFKKRDAAWAKYMKEVVEPVDKRYQKKLKQARDDAEQQVAQYEIEVRRILSLSEKDRKKAKEPKFPVWKDPEHEEIEEFVEPERPTVEQFLPPLDSRWSDIESENIPEERVMSSISDSDIVKVRDAIDSSGYKKPVKKVKDGYQVDKFILRKVK